MGLANASTLNNIFSIFIIQIKWIRLANKLNIAIKLDCSQSRHNSEHVIQSAGVYINSVEV